MTQTDTIRFSRRAEANKVAQEIIDREVRINRATLGAHKAREHGREIAAQYLKRQYETIERDLDN